MLPGSNGLPSRAASGAELGFVGVGGFVQVNVRGNCPRSGATKRMSAAASCAGLGSRNERLGSMASWFQRWMCS
jgi:hypothetical protein